MFRDPAERRPSPLAQGDTAHVTRTGGRDPTPHASGSGVTEAAGLLARGSLRSLHLPDGSAVSGLRRFARRSQLRGQPRHRFDGKNPPRLSGVPFSSVSRRNHFAVAKVPYPEGSSQDDRRRERHSSFISPEHVGRDPRDRLGGTAFRGDALLPARRRSTLRVLGIPHSTLARSRLLRDDPRIVSTGHDTAPHRHSSPAGIARLPGATPPRSRISRRHPMTPRVGSLSR